MKKTIAFILVICMTFTLAACSSQSGEGTVDNQSAADNQLTSDNQSTNEPEESQPAIQPGEQETPAENVDVNNPESDKAVSDTGEDDTPAEESGSKVLVAYFSCTGNTEGIAEHIVNILGADVYEIVPKEPYTDADLNYNDSSSRSTQEQNDDSCRPVISGSVEGMDDYDIVFIGYPIWWGQAPKIIYTFVEGYDLSGKTIVPFCTSSSSGVGSSATNLHSSATGANWLDGTRLGSNSSESDVGEWINGLGLDMR